MNLKCVGRKLRCLVLFSGITAALALALYGCDLVTRDGGEDGNVLLTDALGFKGSISGQVVDSQSTRDSFDSASAQTVPPGFDTQDTIVRFRDVAGNDLLDPNGQPIEEVPVDTDGFFTAEGLPVGTDFTVCVDIGQDTTCEIETYVNIPSDDGGPEGVLTDVQADPLSTLVLAKLRRLIRDLHIDPEDLSVSPTAIVTRILTAYKNLFEEAGVDHRITLDDLIAQSGDALAAFFDSEIPASARTGMQMVEGNLELSQAVEAEELALAVAKVFLVAGFPIADLPGPPDFSALADLDDVTTVSRRELFGSPEPFGDDQVLDELVDELPQDVLDELRDRFPNGLPEDFAESLPDDLRDRLPEGFLDQVPDGLLDEIINEAAEQRLPDATGAAEQRIYVSMVTEPDRNLLNVEGELDVEIQRRPPVMVDRMLLEMARLHLEHRRITLAALYDLLTSLDAGLGLRLTFFIADANFVGPPLTVFETADGKGRAINPERLFRRFMMEGLDEVNQDSFTDRESEVRQLLRELLGDTVAPEFDRLFDGFILQRVGGVEALAQGIREARAHLPFNRSGPSTLFVVADRDPFRSPEDVPGVTVDAEFSARGEVTSVTYNAAGEGRFYLGFTRGTQNEGIVRLIVRETGRVLHGARGPALLSIFDETVFEPVDGEPFAALVSESGTFYPPIHVPVIDADFAPESQDGTEPAYEQLVVLATRPGEGAEPVRVDYDPATSVATYNPLGRYLMMFLPDSQETGVFALFNERMGQQASLLDPDRFFDRPFERPEDFEDLFNENPDFDDTDRLDDFLADEDNASTEGDDAASQEEDVPPSDEQTADENAAQEGGESPAPEDPPAEQEIPDDAGEEAIDGQDEGEVVEDEEAHDDEDEYDVFDRPEPILVAAADVVGLDLHSQTLTRVFGTEVPNERYEPSADPFFDDINDNGVEDLDEPTSPFRPTLFDPADWRSTDIRLYYRRADNGHSVCFAEIRFEAETPETIDGVELVRRNFRPRLNAFRFGRPNTAVNLLTAFLPPDFFDGTHDLNRDTAVDIFSAIAIINLVMDQVFNVEADVDVDGFGPLPRARLLVDARPFVVPLGDPFVLLIKGFHDRSIVVTPEQ